MRKATGYTINDLVLAGCAGGLRRYLARTGELPEQDMIAGCPVSLRAPGDNRPGNQVTMMNVELATSEQDPLARLGQIHESAEIAKAVVQDLSGLYESNAALPGLPAMITGSLRAAESLGIANFAQSPINLVISNVPGPGTTRYSNGARLLAHYPVSIPTHGLGLNITVQTYEETMYLGVTACRKALPHADALRDDLLVAFRELRNLILGSSVRQLETRQAEIGPEQPEPGVAEEKVNRELVA
jgi:WS/DGAT/MGAT family acyltransferase